MAALKDNSIIAIMEIADHNDCGFDVYCDLELKEIFNIPNIDNSTYTDYNEFYQDQIELIDSKMGDLIKIEAPSSNESYNIMLNFIGTITNPILKEKLSEAVNKSKPFQKFNIEINTSPERESWFKFKNRKLIDRVIIIINKAST